ncbi:MAG: regulatory protein RecX [Bacteroidales bacterium]
MSKSQRNITPAQALARLQRSCSLRETCSYAAQQKLITWRIDPTEATKILQQLIAEKWIDDLRYACAYTREKSQLSKWGAQKIQVHLQAKRISTDIIRTAISQIDSDMLKENLEQLLAKKLRSIKPTSKAEVYAKLLRFGVSRGFAYHEVTALVKSLLQTHLDEV